MKVIQNKGFRAFLYILGYVSAAAILLFSFVTGARYMLFDGNLSDSGNFAETPIMQNSIYEQLYSMQTQVENDKRWEESGIEEAVLPVYDFSKAEEKDILLHEKAKEDSYSGIQAALINAGRDSEYEYYNIDSGYRAAFGQLDPDNTVFVKISVPDLTGLFTENASFYGEEWGIEEDSSKNSEREKLNQQLESEGYYPQADDYYMILSGITAVYSPMNQTLYRTGRGMLSFRDGITDLYIAVSKNDLSALEKDQTSDRKETCERLLSGYFFTNPYSAFYRTLTDSEKTLITNIGNFQSSGMGHMAASGSAVSNDGKTVDSSYFMGMNEPWVIGGEIQNASGTYPELTGKIREKSDIFICYDKEKQKLEQWYKQRNGSVKEYEYVKTLSDFSTLSESNFVFGVRLYDTPGNYYVLQELAFVFCKAIPYPIVFLVISALIFLACVIFLMVGEPVRMRPWDKIPYEIFVAAYAVILILLIRGAVYSIGNNISVLLQNERAGLILIILLVILLAYVLTAALFMTTLRRIRCRAFLKTLLSARIITALIHGLKILGRKILNGCRNLSDLYETTLKGKTRLLIFTVGLLLIHVIAFFIFGMLTEEGIIPALFLIAVDVFAVYKLLMYSGEADKLLAVSREIEAGNLDAKADVNEYRYNTKELAESLNHLGEGLSKAVESSIRDERTKAELITNVSHDIKTPLTSIINYVDLLKKEDIENEKAREYIDVLDRKSQRLKQLILDLIEVSKTNTGNIELERMNLNLAELVSQCLGEYREKLAASDLETVESIGTEEAWIYADGRRVFRIIDNLFNNVVKYSQPGTRVYIELKQEENQGKKEAVFSVKNVSREMLNVTADELMERFVRGDRSRHTEGSGLGLSIAKNLTELQNGRFRIFVDGDLFKAEVAFPLSSSH